jgi:hypothetical protein
MDAIGDRGAVRDAVTAAAGQCAEFTAVLGNSSNGSLRELARRMFCAKRLTIAAHLAVVRSLVTC